MLIGLPATFSMLIVIPDSLIFFWVLLLILSDELCEMYISRVPCFNAVSISFSVGGLLKCILSIITIPDPNLFSGLRLFFSLCLVLGFRFFLVPCL